MSTLSEEEIRRLEKAVEEYLGSAPSITNREIRRLTSISYDQAIYFFNYMVRSGKLRRIGVASQTRYENP